MKQVFFFVIALLLFFGCKSDKPDKSDVRYDNDLLYFRTADKDNTSFYLFLKPKNDRHYIERYDTSTNEYKIADVYLTMRKNGDVDTNTVEHQGQRYNRYIVQKATNSRNRIRYLDVNHSWEHNNATHSHITDTPGHKHGPIIDPTKNQQ